MTVECVHPAGAWAAVLLVLATGVLTVRSRLSWRARLAALVLPLISAACVALALAEPSSATQSRGAAPVVILLDLSPSTRTVPWRDPEWLRRQAQQRLGSRRPVTVVGFAAQPRVLLRSVMPADTQHWPVEWSDITPPRNATDIAAAFAWRSDDETDARTLAPRWLITDGLFATPPTVPFPLAVSIVPPATLDVAIHDLQVRRAASDAIEILIQVRAVGPLPQGQSALHVTVHVMRDDTPLADPELSLTSPTSETSLNVTQWLSVRDTLPPGDPHAHRYTATITPRDAWPENDTAAILWRPLGLRRTLVLSNNPVIDPQGPLAGARVIRPSEFHASAAQLAADAWQTIVLEDLPVVSGTPPVEPVLAADAQAAIDRLVRDTGAGLLILGRHHAFAPGGYDRPAGALLDALSPLASRPFANGHGLHVVFLLDASASMNEPVAAADGPVKKFRMLAHAVEQVSHDLLTPQDRVTVLTFNDSAHSIADGPLSDIAPRLHEQLAAIGPGGATVPDTLLSPLTAALRTPAEKHLVLFITDGEIPALDVAAWQAALATPNTALAIIAPSPTSLSPLKNLATAARATWMPAADARIWPRLLDDAITAQRPARQHDTMIDWQAADGTLRGQTHQWIDVWRKPEATLLAVKSADAPLAAVAQRGLGTVAAVAFSDDSPIYSALISRTLERISPPPGDRRVTLAAKKNADGAWSITADAIEGNAFLNGERFTARILTDDGARAFPLQQTAPGHYETTIPHTDTPLNATVLRLASQGGATETLVGHIETPALETAEWPASVDHATTPHDFPGAIDLSDPNAPAWNPPLPAMHAWSPALWLASAILALAALWARR